MPKVQPARGCAFSAGSERRKATSSPFRGRHPVRFKRTARVPGTASALLSRPTRLPGPSWSLPAGPACPFRRNGPNTICGSCYADDVGRGPGTRRPRSSELSGRGSDWTRKCLRTALGSWTGATSVKGVNALIAWAAQLTPKAMVDRHRRLLNEAEALIGELPARVLERLPSGAGVARRLCAAARLHLTGHHLTDLRLQFPRTKAQEHRLLTGQCASLERQIGRVLAHMATTLPSLGGPARSRSTRMSAALLRAGLQSKR